MSTVYSTEPGTDGKVILRTSFGDLEVELWSKEAPKASRNFVQLCMEGYYNGTIFHRLVPNQMIQGGDPTGSGTGGASIYGKDFEDEFHSRLKFNRRGLVGMASHGPGTNGSQFFVTLGPMEHLTRRHTIFGRIGGNTIYNLVPLNTMETTTDDRPVYAPKIIGAEVVANPFPDIVPRKNIALMQQNLLNDSSAAAAAAKRKPPPQNKNTLLSFGDEQGNDDNDTPSFLVKKPRHEIDSDARNPPAPPPGFREGSDDNDDDDDDDDDDDSDDGDNKRKIPQRPGHGEDDDDDDKDNELRRKAELLKMQILGISKPKAAGAQSGGARPGASSSSAAADANKAASTVMTKKDFEAQRAKYLSRATGDKKDRNLSTLEAMKRIKGSSFLQQ